MSNATLTPTQIRGLLSLRDGHWYEVASTTVHRLREAGLAEGKGATLRLTDAGKALVEAAS